MALDLEKMHTAQAKQERIPEGTFMARISSIVDLGVQPQTDWKTGEPTDPKPRVLATWELPTETITVVHNDGTEEELPRLISKEYTLSNYDKSNLMKLLAVLKPTCKSLTELLDIECMVNVGSTVNGNAKIVNVVTPPKGMPVPELTKPAAYFDFDQPTEDLFLTQPQWVRTKIKDAENYTGFADLWGQNEEAAA
jgi:hypothetical protein